MHLYTSIPIFIYVVKLWGFSCAFVILIPLFRAVPKKQQPPANRGPLERITKVEASLVSGYVFSHFGLRRAATLGREPRAADPDDVDGVL